MFRGNDTVNDDSDSPIHCSTLSTMLASNADFSSAFAVTCTATLSLSTAAPAAAAADLRLFPFGVGASFAGAADVFEALGSKNGSLCVKSSSMRFEQ